MSLYVLRKLEKSDLQIRVDWMNNPKVYKTMNFEIPITLENTEKWFHGVEKREDRIDLVLEKDNQLIAMTGFTDKVDGEVKSYTFVDPEFKGRGIGSITLFLKLVYGFKLFGVTSIHSTIDYNNIASRKMCEKMGFELKEVVEDGIEKNGVKIDRCEYYCTPLSFNESFMEFDIVENTVVYDSSKS